jgi:hypothetical protein
LRTGRIRRPRTLVKERNPAEGFVETKPLPPARPPSTSCPCDQET